jgi:phosphoribosylformylglycinamidine cyclo-ligase
MCINDLLTTGADPLFFLDYIATGKINKSNLEKVIEGIIFACDFSECVLLGGETAEMPDLYDENTYDLAGFSVGIVEENDILGKGKVKKGDLIIGLPSSGLHSNGYSLVRKILKGFDLSKTYTGFDKSLIELILEPTKIYTKEVKFFKSSGILHAIANITGGGLLENVSRILPDGLHAKIDPSKWVVPEIFNFLEREGPVDNSELFRTFNMGIGMVLILDKEFHKYIKNKKQTNKIDYLLIGEIIENRENVEKVLVTGLHT